MNKQQQDIEIKRHWLYKYSKVFGLENYSYMVEEDYDINYRGLALAFETKYQYDPIERERAEKRLLSMCDYDRDRMDRDSFSMYKRKSTVNSKTVLKQFYLATVLLELFGSAETLAESNGYHKCPVCGTWFTDHGESSELCFDCSGEEENIQDTELDSKAYSDWLHQDTRNGIDDYLECKNHAEWLKRAI